MADADPHDPRLSVTDATPAEPPIEPGIEPAPPPNKRRKTLLLGIAAAVLIGGAGYGGYYMLVGSHYVSTDNAYVGANTAQVTPMVAGQAIAVLKSDTDSVKRGDVLVRLDDRDAQIALATVEADLAKAQRQFGQAAATSSSLSAQVDARGSDVLSARPARHRDRRPCQGADRIKPSPAIRARRCSLGRRLTASTNALAAARAGVEQARAAVAQASSSRGAAAGTLAANEALISGTTIVTAPDVLAAKARVEQARLDLERTVIRAPIDGIVANRTIQVGQRVAPGATVMRIVPVAQVYVDANFKEGQLRKVAAGQPVTLTSDVYGSSVKFHGRVAGFSGGTGSAFALIPAQNATGNWIKVVQRLPVRVVLDPKELANHPLRVGLSMSAEIDTSAK